MVCPECVNSHWSFRVCEIVVGVYEIVTGVAYVKYSHWGVGVCKKSLGCRGMWNSHRLSHRDVGVCEIVTLGVTVC